VKSSDGKENRTKSFGYDDENAAPLPSTTNRVLRDENVSPDKASDPKLAGYVYEYHVCGDFVIFLFLVEDGFLAWKA